MPTECLRQNRHPKDPRTLKFGQQRFEQLIEYAQNHYHYVQQGHFGADMQVSLTNDGPATFWLEV